MTYLRRVWSDWQTFWFAPVSLYNVSLFRMLLGLSITVMYAIRFTNFDIYFGSDGLIPFDWALKVVPPGYASAFAFFMKTDGGIKLQGILHLVLLVLFTLGVFGRSLTWLLAIVNVGLMQRNMTVIYGADLFTNFWLFYLALVDHNRHFSIWNFIRKNRPIAEWTDALSTVGVRLVQIQLCVSYAYTGVEKFKGSVWWEGSAVWYVIGMQEIVSHDFSFMQNFPAIIAALSMATIIFETYFIFAVWSPKLRYPWLLTGIFFHIGTAIFMDLWFFAAVVLAAYLLFFPDLREAFKRLRASFARNGALT